MNKIQLVSGFFKCIFQMAFVLMPILLIIFWLNAPEPLSSLTAHYGLVVNYIPNDINIAHDLSPTTKLLGFIISLIPLSIDLLVLSFLIRLFKLFQSYEIFSSRTVNHIKHIGYTLLFGQIANPIYHLLLSIALTWNNPAGERYASISFNGTNVGILLAALLIILISWINSEAQKLHVEQQYTI